MFYFITFIHVVRWCNLRSKPKRETRGVSRSKCADLITACVPVSWALSIIISETVDATDYYDGFGTGEVVIGIRAYQWGWEYFYPKNIDLNYNVTPSYSSFIGNSIKYNNTSSEQLDANAIWKFYQKKNKTAQVNTPAYTILSPNDSNSSMNSIDFSSVGNSISSDTNAFSKIHRLSKISSNNVTTNFTNDNLVFSKINNLYLSNNTLNQDSYQYGSARQHNYSSLNSFLPSFSTLVDTNSFKKFFDYTLNTSSAQQSLPYSNNFFNAHTEDTFNPAKSSVNNLLNFTSANSLSGTTYPGYETHFFKRFLLDFTSLVNVNATNDGKNNNNPFLSYHDKSSSKKVTNMKKPSHFSVYDDLTESAQHNFYTWNIFNSAKSYRFTDLKSSNLQFLSPDKNLRYTVNKGVSSTNRDFDPSSNIASFVKQNNSLTSNINNSYGNSTNNWSNPNITSKILSTNTTFSSTYNPVASTSSLWNNISYDKLNNYSNGDVPTIMRGKEEVAPEHLFSAYWNSYYRNISLNNNYKHILGNINNLKSMYIPSILEYSEYDFKNWQALESLEDSIWESSHSSFAQEDYSAIKATSITSTYYDKIQTLYNMNSRTQEGSKFKFKAKIAYRSLLNKLQSQNIYSLPVSSENLFINPANTNLLNFNYFNNDSSIESTEESYENLKNLQFLYFSGTKNVVLPSFNFLLPTSFTQVLDSFRPDFDENNWDVDYEADLSNSLFVDKGNTLNLTNSLKLRSTAKNSIVTYNAIQKVYKARFDELRANINFQDFTNSFSAYPFLLESKTPYENILKKK
jgi:hypothetical protein